ncbi:hypothetical protein V5O48_017307 [Marasmius crinis-equi]|uniref:Uncharacterized protein n=1 Tax=Marasmius crinis-equi TaxID=585013 RepID=A0ABR3EPG9_9AGAR
MSRAFADAKYKDMTDEQKQKMIDNHEAAKDELEKERVTRPSQKSCAQDVQGTISNVIKLLKGLKHRQGVEAMCLVFRNRTEPFMDPKWYFSNEKINTYMNTLYCGWDAVDVGQKLEAFAVAGFDAAATLKTAPERLNAARKEVSGLVQDKLDEACGTHVKMDYERFDKLITLEWRVVKVNWPVKFQRPGAFGSVIGPLVALCTALEKNECGFRKLSDEEFMAWKEARERDLASGEIKEKERKKRSDAGKKRKRDEKGKGRAEEEEDSRLSLRGGFCRGRMSGTIGSVVATLPTVLKQHPI